MRYIYILVLRILLSLIMASLISLLFFNGIGLYKTSLLAGIMFVLAYLFEYTRNRDKG